MCRNPEKSKKHDSILTVDLYIHGFGLEKNQLTMTKNSPKKSRCTTGYS